MTILGKMSTSINPKHNIDPLDQLSHNSFDEFVRSRGRSNRAGSLALPNNSLLDFYDKQQEQCSSATLLPTPNPNIIRRHSAHCYPTSDNKNLNHQPQQQQQQQQQQQPNHYQNQNSLQQQQQQQEISKSTKINLKSSQQQAQLNQFKTNTYHNQNQFHNQYQSSNNCSQHQSQNLQQNYTQKSQYHHQQQQQQQQQQQYLKHQRGEQIKLSSPQSIVSSPSSSTSTSASGSTVKPQSNQLKSNNSISMEFKSNSITPMNNHQQQQQQQTKTQVAVNIVQSIAAKAVAAVALIPPPPIPKRTFNRGKFLNRGENQSQSYQHSINHRGKTREMDYPYNSIDETSDHRKHYYYGQNPSQSLFGSKTILSSNNSPQQQLHQENINTNTTKINSIETLKANNGLAHNNLNNKPQQQIQPQQQQQQQQQQQPILNNYSKSGAETSIVTKPLTKFFTNQQQQNSLKNIDPSSSSSSISTTKLTTNNKVITNNHNNNIDSRGHYNNSSLSQQNQHSKQKQQQQNNKMDNNLVNSSINLIKRQYQLHQKNYNNKMQNFNSIQNNDDENDNEDIDDIIISRKNHHHQQILSDDNDDDDTDDVENDINIDNDDEDDDDHMSFDNNSVFDEPSINTIPSSHSILSSSLSPKQQSSIFKHNNSNVGNCIGNGLLEVSNDLLCTTSSQSSISSGNIIISPRGGSGGGSNGSGGRGNGSHSNSNDLQQNDIILMNGLDITTTAATPSPSPTTISKNIMNNSRYSNRSSSDSNKSQLTIDTGYISSNNGSEKNLTSVDSSAALRTSPNANSSNNGGDFRSRFSSVDTQSSLDSCLTEKTIDSPLSKESFRIEPSTSISPIYPSNNGTNSNSTNSNSNKNQNRNLPTVPNRSNNSKQQQSQQKISSSSNENQNTNNNSKSRPIPPTPPLRQQQSTNDSTVNYQNVPNLIGSGRKLPSLSNFGSSSTNSSTETNNMSFRKKLTKTRPPPITYPKIHQRQDSNISSDSFSMTSSPGYNSKSLEAPLIQNASKINKCDIRQHNNTEQGDSTSFVIPERHKSTKTTTATSGSSLSSSTSSSSGSGGTSNTKLNQTQSMKNSQQNSSSPQPPPPANRITTRQDSTISSDSFSQTSSPGYNSKIMEAPLIPTMKKLLKNKQTFKIPNDTIQEHQDQPSTPNSPITKSTSTPASLQTVVKFQNGTSNMSLQHKIINRRKSSALPYVTDNNRLKFRLLQLFVNALALLAIAGGLIAYFNAYPTIKFVNKTIIYPAKVPETTNIVSVIGKNPAPGICLPIIVKFCQTPYVPYNYTVFPNYIGHFGQLETQVDLEAYDALVDVRCYELVSLFLCTLFVPKCGTTGTTVPPCKSLCMETMRRCGFFFDVFGLQLPDYLNCNLFTDSKNPEECVGYSQVRKVWEDAVNPTCHGFLCDRTRCIPNDWRCDGHVDCMDQTDELNCDFCDENSIYCGENRCMSQKQMCDGTIDCPYAQDERSCIRLSERNGDVGRGLLEIYKVNGTKKQFVPACVSNWDLTVSPPTVCSMLGYDSVFSHKITKGIKSIPPSNNSTLTTSMQRQHPTQEQQYSYRQRNYNKDHVNLIKEFSKCPTEGSYSKLELTCGNFDCGKVKNKRHRITKRIVGGEPSNPGDWPFLAAILGGPEEIFYCAGVLIADQWVLTASHCIGNHTLRDINDWTIQLGVTRRNSHTYYGQKLKVKTVIPHPQYNTDVAHDNDIALFQLSKRVGFHEHLLPVCLPPPHMQELKAGTVCTVIGWGKREDKNVSKNQSAITASYELSVNEVKVPVVKREKCDEWLESLNVTDGMICAGYEEGGKDACQGDSGGPLLCPYPGERDKWFVGGIVSWGIMCAHPKLPGVYANVPKYIPWIKSEIMKYTKRPSSDSNSNNNGNKYLHRKQQQQQQQNDNKYKQNNNKNDKNNNNERSTNNNNIKNNNNNSNKNSNININANNARRNNNDMESDYN